MKAEETLPPVSVLNSGWPHREDSPTLVEPGPPANSDSDSGHLSGEDPEDSSAQGPAVLGLGPPHLDTNQAPNWPGLRTLLQQLPPQDSDERYCLALGKEELAELRLFCTQRKQEALGQGVAHLVPPKLEGHTCEKCREQLKPGEYAMFAARAGEQRCWHWPCFACQACGQALINLIYFYHDGHLYCGRHHAGLLRPRCPACDQLIFSRQCTEAEGRRWHENHFCCQDCAGPLGGGRYALPGGSPCCSSYFESRYSYTVSSPAGALEGRTSLDPSLGARSSHRASLARALQGPPEPTPRHDRGCGVRLAPGRGTRPPSGGRRRGTLDDSRRQRARPGAGREAGPNRGQLQLFAAPGSERRKLGALRWVFPIRPGTAEAEPDRIEGKNCASLKTVTVPVAALLSASTVGSSLKTQRGLLGSSPEQECRAEDLAEAPKGRDQDRLEAPQSPKEDAPCPICSSSSDSEPEGIFLSQRLPRPWKTPRNLQAGDSDTSRKHYSIC